jgi:ketosteroid isomerase-like protein
VIESTAPCSDPAPSPDILVGMSEEILEIVRRLYCPADREIVDTDLLDVLDEYVLPNTEFDFTDTYPDGPVVRGLERTRRLMANWPWGELHFEPERFIDVDDERVLVFVRATARGAGSGVPVERRTAHECTFREGRLVRFKVYSDREQALAAAARRGSQGDAAPAHEPSRMR